MSFTWSLANASLNEVEKFAARLAPHLEAGDFIALSGELGSGKTVFARAVILSLLGPENLCEVPSPTFSIVQDYESARFAIHHFDFYRLNQPDEALELGLDEALGGGLVLAEWPQRLEGHLPENRLDICITDGRKPDLRNLELIGHGPWGGRLGRLKQIDLFLFGSGWGEAERTYLQGQAGSRSRRGQIPFCRAAGAAS